VPGTCEFRLSAECHSYPVPRALFNSKCMYAKFRSLSLDARPLRAHTLNAFIKQPPDTYLQCYRETTVDLTTTTVTTTNTTTITTTTATSPPGDRYLLLLLFFGTFFVRIFSLTIKMYEMWSIYSIVYGFSDRYMIRSKKKYIILLYTYTFFLFHPYSMVCEILTYFICISISDKFVYLFFFGGIRFNDNNMLSHILIVMLILIIALIK